MTKCLENFVSQTLGFITRFCAAELREYISDVINKAATLPPRTPISKYRDLLPDKWKQKNIAQE